MEVFVNIYHFDMPAYLFAKGGWENREVVGAYGNYAKAAFVEFANEIRYCFTFNEPIVEPEQRYKDGNWYPFVKDIRRAIATQYHISLAHAIAVGEFRKLQEQGVVAKDVRIGLINSFSPPYTKEEPSEADLDAVRMEDGICNRWWLDLATRGSLPEDVITTLETEGAPIPERPGDKEILSMGCVDWLGVNYYQPRRVQAPKHKRDANGNPVFSDPYIWEGRRMNETRGWEIYPKGIYDFGMKLKNDYPKLEFFISENGMGIEKEVTKSKEVKEPSDGSV